MAREAETVWTGWASRREARVDATAWDAGASHAFERGPIRVCFPFAGADVGGSHVSALKLIQGFDRRRVTPVVALHEPQSPLATFLEKEGQPFVTLDARAALSADGRLAKLIPGYVLRTVPDLRRFIRDGRFDIVHTNDGPTHANWGPPARLAGAKLVWHHRGDPDARSVNILAPMLAHHVVTVSRFAQPRSPVLTLDGRLSVVHSPFDPPRSRPDRVTAKAALLKELCVAQDTHVLGFFGLLIDRKRPTLFVDIVDRFRAGHPDIPVVGCLFGISPMGERTVEEAARARAAALGLGDVIRFMGFRSPVEPVLSATDVLVVPAAREPFGRTLIEAMFLGTPVVASDDGGNPEAIRQGSTGFLVPGEDADAYVPPLAALLNDPALWARIGRAGEEYACSHFSARRHVEQIMEIYDRVMARGRRTPSDSAQEGEA